MNINGKLSALGLMNPLAAILATIAKEVGELTDEDLQCLDEKTLLLVDEDQVQYFRIVSLMEIQADFQIEFFQLSLGPTMVDYQNDTLVLGPPSRLDHINPSIISQMNELTQYLKPWDQTTFWADYRCPENKVKISHAPIVPGWEGRLQ